jgi:hypothetical protein
MDLRDSVEQAAQAQVVLRGPSVSKNMIWLGQEMLIQSHSIWKWRSWRISELVEAAIADYRMFLSIRRETAISRLD